MLARVIRAVGHFLATRPDVVHAHNPTSLHYARLGKLAARSRLVVTYHGKGFGEHRRATPGEWRACDAVAAVSEQARTWLREEGYDGPAQVILNGVRFDPPTEARMTIRSELGLGDAFTLIMVARIDDMKGHDTLLQAAALLREAGQSPALLLVGDGERRRAMQAMARELGLGADARFLGYRRDIPNLLAAADLFVLPSRSEGMPLSVLEAMAAGLPVVATRVGGVPELVSDGVHGLLVSIDDAPALAGAIRRLMSDPASAARMGSAGRDRVNRQFSFDAMLDAYDRIYTGATSSEAAS
jgi:glycosyltransferase involved in cell wall biosynthesis